MQMKSIYEIVVRKCLGIYCSSLINKEGIPFCDTCGLSIWSIHQAQARNFFCLFVSVEHLFIYLFILFFFLISWRLITLQYCSGFCHTRNLKWSGLSSFGKKKWSKIHRPDTHPCARRLVTTRSEGNSPSETEQDPVVLAPCVLCLRCVCGKTLAKE